MKRTVFLYLITVLIFLMQGCATNSSLSKEYQDFTIKNGVKTLNKLSFPPWKDPDKYVTGICWQAKLCWKGSHWERQIVLFNGADKPPAEHPIYDYVRNLPAPEFEGTEKYQGIYNEYFKCELSSQSKYNFEDQYNRFRNYRDFRIGEGTHPNTGRREYDRTMAKAVALRNIIEQYGAKVESNTRVIDYQIAMDTVKVQANKSVQFVPAVEQYHNRDGQSEYQVVIFGWLDE